MKKVRKKRKKEEKKIKEKKEYRFPFFCALIFVSLFLFFLFAIVRSFVRLSLVANYTPGSGGARVYMSDSLSATHSEPNICRVIDE